MEQSLATIEDSLGFMFALVAIGMIGKLVWRMSDLEATGTLMKPTVYIQTYRWRTAAAIMGGFIGAYVFYRMDQLNAVTALYTGMSCTEVIDSLRARAVGRMRTLAASDAAADLNQPERT